MKSNRRIMYLRDSRFQPVGCLAFSLSKDKKTIRYQLSVLNPVDRFERSLARQIALGRLVEGPIKIHNISGAESGTDVVFEIMNDLIGRSDLPNRARKAAKAWLCNDDATHCRYVDDE